MPTNIIATSHIRAYIFIYLHIIWVTNFTFPSSFVCASRLVNAIRLIFTAYTRTHTLTSLHIEIMCLYKYESIQSNRIINYATHVGADHNP